MHKLVAGDIGGLALGLEGFIVDDLYALGGDEAVDGVALGSLLVGIGLIVFATGEQHEAEQQDGLEYSLHDFILRR